MTAKNARTIPFVLLTIATAFVTPTAFAHDSTSTIMTFEPFGVSDSENIWYDINSLNNTQFDGSINNGDLFRLIAEVPRHAIDSTDFDVTEVSEYTWGTTSRIDAQYLGSTNVFGQTESYEFTGYHYKVVYLNTNSNLDYSSTSGCNSSYGIVPASYILNHELGHFAGLNHHTWWPFESTHTAMKGGCNIGQASLRAADIADIDGYYT